MSQPKRTYGRRIMISEPTRNFLNEMKSSSKLRKRHFKEEAETISSELLPKKPCVSPFEVPQKLQQPQSQGISRKRPRPFDQGGKEHRPPAKKHLPSPPSDFDSILNHPRDWSTMSRNQKNRYHKKQQKSNLTSCAMNSDPNLPPLPSPPPSLRGGSVETSFAATGADYSDALVDEKVGRFAKGPPLRDQTLTTTPAVPTIANGRAIKKLDAKVLEKILSYVLPLEGKRSIRPFYRQGMMKDGIISMMLDDESVADADNIDLSVFRVNKAFHQAGASLFYRSSFFFFQDPDVYK